MDHSQYIGKLDSDETQDLLDDILSYVENDDLVDSLVDELSREDLIELTRRLTEKVAELRKP